MSVSSTQFLSAPRPQSGGDLAIEIRGLTKSYASRRVLDGVDLTVERGQLISLLGPNGAGKTTTVRVLATLLAPDAGVARVAGYDVVRERSEVRHRISLTGQDVALDQLLTGRENLQMVGRLRRLSAVEARRAAHELLTGFELVSAADRRVATYSGGMRRRLDLAAGLIGHPEVVFLDEPTTGLDPRSRQTMWETIRGLTDAGVTVLLTTQYLDEADTLADRIIVLDKGRIAADGSAAALKELIASARLDIQLADAVALAEVAARLGDRVARLSQVELTVSVAIHGEASEIRRLLDELDPEGERIEGFSLHQASLDDVFMALTGDPTGPSA